MVRKVQLQSTLSVSATVEPVDGGTHDTKGRAGLVPLVGILEPRSMEVWRSGGGGLDLADDTPKAEDRP